MFGREGGLEGVVVLRVIRMLRKGRIWTWTGMLFETLVACPRHRDL